MKMKLLWLESHWRAPLTTSIVLQQLLGCLQVNLVGKTPTLICDLVRGFILFNPSLGMDSEDQVPH